MKICLKLFLSVAVLFCCLSSQAVLAQDESYINEKLSSIGFGKGANKDVKDEITELFEDFDKYSDTVNMRKIKSFFSKDFINNDGFDYSLYMKSIKDGADLITNRKSKTEILSIDVCENYVIVHVKEYGEAETAKDSADKLGKGILIVYAEVYYTLQKEGNNWKILSANVVDEICKMLYGEAKNIYFFLNTPMQVKEDTEYTATLSFQLAPDCVAMSSISSEPIVYPVPKNKDVFKPVNQDGVLERIFRANTSRHNEYAIASVGITKPELMSAGTVNVKLIGTAYIIKRVNVFSVTKNIKNNKQ